jgi:hypothetical protein
MWCFFTLSSLDFELTSKLTRIEKIALVERRSLKFIFLPALLQKITGTGENEFPFIGGNLVAIAIAIDQKYAVDLMSMIAAVDAIRRRNAPSVTPILRNIIRAALL